MFGFAVWATLCRDSHRAPFLLYIDVVYCVYLGSWSLFSVVARVLGQGKFTAANGSRGRSCATARCQYVFRYFQGLIVVAIR